jgi:hypothetical protein
LFSEPILLPSAIDHNAPIPTTIPNASETTTLPFPIRQITREQQRILWHQRLGHIHPRQISNAHKNADGIPVIANATELDKCPICARAKLHRAARGTSNSRRATNCFQGISIDFGFIVQTSNADSTRIKRLQGLHGETCYCLLVDHFSGMLFGQCFQSKEPPIQFLTQWLAKHGLDNTTPDRYVRFDLGGELGRCREVVNLFSDAGYTVEATAPDSSHQNGPGERPHHTIADAIRTMLAGAALPNKFWPYAFHHFLRIYNVTVHGDKTTSPFEICSGRKPDLSLLRVFGCRVYALPTRPHHPHKLIDDSRIGIFLGYAQTMKNIIYYDTDSETVKTAQHVIFDESMNDVARKPPNARLLNMTLDHLDDLDFVDLRDNFPDLDIAFSPFTKLVTIIFQPDFDDFDNPLGFEYQQCPRLLRPYISAVIRPPTPRQSLRTFRTKYTGAFITAIDDSPVYCTTKIDAALQHLKSLREFPTQINITLAPERLRDLKQRAQPPLHLRRIDLRTYIAYSHPSHQ